MLNGEATPGGVPCGAGQTDELAWVAEGIFAYLREIEGYRAACRRHEGTAAIDEHGSGLHVMRCFEDDGNALAHLASALRRLPLWRAGGTRGKGVAKRSRRGAPCLAGGDIDWEGRRFLVRAWGEDFPSVLRVDLCVFPWQSDLPELPLRTVAAALRCHEFLVSEGVAPLLPVPPGERRGVREYLERTMPKNLYASQCI